MITFTTKSGIAVTCEENNIEEIRDICNEILGEGWQPIETAPKDGTPLPEPPLEENDD